ncbi:MAG: sterol desaturase family protein [Actinomycetota bacterium]
MGDTKTRWLLTPELPLQPAPFYRTLHPGAILTHVARTWRPWGTRVFMLAVAACIWWFAAPDLDDAQRFSFGWMSQIWLRNLVLVAVITGGLHWWLWIKKAQQDLRYDKREMGRDKRIFLFDDQVKDNMFLTLVSAMAIGSLWESIGWWAYANDIAPTISWDDNPVWFVALFALIPLWSIMYFSVTHWLLHRGPAYTHVHSWHHKNVNVGPWSGLAMHPLEHVVLYGDVLLFLVLPAHPAHFLFAMMHHSLGAPMSHTGHDALRLPGGIRFELGDFFHQLHHRFIECNYGGQESPLDLAIDAWHDGTPDGDAATAARRRKLSMAKRGAPA